MFHQTVAGAVCSCRRDCSIRISDGVTFVLGFFGPPWALPEPRWASLAKIAKKKKKMLLENNVDAHMSKTALRHYMDNTSAFWLDGASTEHDYFRTRDVMRPRTTTNCEALARPGYFPSFYSANSDAGIDALLGLFGQRGQPDKACIGKLVEMLQSSGAQQFWAAVPYFNAKCDKDRAPEDSERHLECMLSFLGDNVDELHELIVMLAEASARLYLFAISSIEIPSLLSHTDDWADKIAKQWHPPEVSQWKRRPDDPEAFKCALWSVFEERLCEEMESGKPASARLRKYTQGDRGAPVRPSTTTASSSEGIRRKCICTRCF